MATKKKKNTGAFTVVKAEIIERKVRQAGKDVLSFNAKEIEDHFIGLMGLDAFIEPPLDPTWLKALVTHNNTLNQCIAAMEVNIDGSGYVIEQEDKGIESDEVEEDNDPPVSTNGGKPKKPKKPEKTPEEVKMAKAIKNVEEFFAEVAPGVGFTTLRRALRRDLESCGNAYMEVLRNADGQLMALRHVDAATVRLLKLGGSVSATKMLIRGGKEIPLQMMVRERRFLQIVGTDKVFFKEFKASRDLDRITGDWQGDKEEEKVEFQNQATEIIHLTVDRDALSPYGVPRWVNNLPSVLGSRKAEESNLVFFDSGGVPPIMITLLGGHFAEDVKKQIQNFLNSKNVMSRIMVLEAISASGTFEKGAQNFKIDVQRFGSDQVKDSLFENYDERCSFRVRSSFRLPPLFIGQTKETNFATALVTYMVAETQIFKPERDEFDEVVNRLIMPELGVEGVRFRSLPITLQDMKLQLEGLKLGIKESGVEPEEILKTINEITGQKIVFDEEAAQPDPPPDFPPDPSAQAQPPQLDAKGKPIPPPKPGGGQIAGRPPSVSQTPNNPVKVAKRDTQELMMLADDLLDLIEREDKPSVEYQVILMEKIDGLDEASKEFVQSLVTFKLFDSVSVDREGAHSILDSCMQILKRGVDED